MTISKWQRAWSLCSLLAGAALLPGCTSTEDTRTAGEHATDTMDDNSSGLSTTGASSGLGTTGTTETTGTTATTATTASTGGATTSDETASSTTATTEATTTTTTDSTGPEPVECPKDDAFTCEASSVAMCDEPMSDCGNFLSPFDWHGCLRPACQAHEDCGKDGWCLRGDDWGSCSPSGVTCADVDDVCTCDLSGECGGGYCLDVEVGGADSGRVDEVCLDGVPYLVFRIGYVSPECGDGGSGIEGYELGLSADAPLAPGTYNTHVYEGWGTFIPPGDLPIGFEDFEIEISNWEAGVVEGSYFIPPLLHVGDFTLNHCPTQDPCA